MHCFKNKWTCHLMHMGRSKTHDWPSIQLAQMYICCPCSKARHTARLKSPLRLFWGCSYTLLCFYLLSVYCGQKEDVSLSTFVFCAVSNTAASAFSSSRDEAAKWCASLPKPMTKKQVFIPEENIMLQLSWIHGGVHSIVIKSRLLAVAFWGFKSDLWSQQQLLWDG